MLSSRSVLGLFALALAGSCSHSATTARLTSLDPFDAADCEYEQFTNDAGESFVEHPLFGCVRAADLVRIRYDLAPGSDGRPRTGFVYGNGNGTEFTPRSVLNGLAIGTALRASYEVRHGFVDINGPAVVSSIPELDGRVRTATPPLDRRECVGMRSEYD